MKKIIYILSFLLLSALSYGQTKVTIRGNSGGSTALAVQEVTSGTSVTVNANTDVLVVNPAATLSTLTITMPSAMKTGQTLHIVFGGSVTSGTVVTSLSISPNTGQSMIQNSTPSVVEAGETVSYKYYSGKWYRIN